MSRLEWSARPAVLRCTRCGRFVDWEEARLQITCDCRTHVGSPLVVVRPGEAEDAEIALSLFRRDFGHTRIVAFGEPVVLEGAPLIVAFVKGELAGALAYRERKEALQILALATDPMWQRSGVAGELLDEIERAARGRGMSRLQVSTTNDNLPALYFYQRRGFQLVEAISGGMLPHLKDPRTVGFAGIPVRDEMRFERALA